MMESLSLPSIPVAPKTSRLSQVQSRCLSTKRNGMIFCQSGKNVVKTSKVSSVFTVSPDNGSALLDVAGSLVLNPNGNGQTEIVNKDLMPYNGALLDVHDKGIGIVKYLQGKGFLITGATGFLAKVLIEKILRTVPDVGKIYLLIKAKNKEAANERMKNEIINTELFRCLQQKHGKSYQAFMLSKLVPVVGNVCESNLGLDDDTATAIMHDVNIIVNSAANTTFDERYDVSLDINTGGPSRAMLFAKKCKKLKLFLQISTAYVNGQRQGRVMEKPFSFGDSIARERMTFGTTETSSFPMLSVQDEIKLVLDRKQGLEGNALAQNMKELGSERAKKYGWQDTYVFSKAMGEMLIDNMRGDVPVVIIRPSVIESTYKEPFPGWMEGNRMMDPIVLYYGKGQLTGFLVDPNGVLDVVPADMVVNATLAAIAKHGAAGKSESNIYQIASSVVNPLVFRDLANLLYEHFNSLPCVDAKGRPIRVPTMKVFNTMEDFSFHLWKDTIRRTGLADLPNPNGKYSRKLEYICRKSVEQAKYLANIYAPYTFYGGRFDNSNTERLMRCMSEEEKRTFGFDVGSINWRDYITNVHIPGLRRHVMKGRGMLS
ncbi:fatty acyl-CoA reductase 2, chloroplastic [Daucus carota subsp. sativus]|uniref:fatty acyl-CoA reductase 2, chloroplastic n=1 Tax=Daucus carota subsp. sativus TaxID=79200 RepID=UPI0007B2C123|nr:PREDICTED: fatty acyl-CoA reductase 2-like [Daucus carota subsp. sativus]